MCGGGGWLTFDGGGRYRCPLLFVVQSFIFCIAVYSLQFFIVVLINNYKNVSRDMNKE